MIYHTFVGIDIGKHEFVTAIHGEKVVKIYSNTKDGNSSFLTDYKAILENSLVVLENTGGYENELLLFLLNNNVAVHRADTRKVKNYIKSYGQKGKTDKIDALALASYAYERQSSLDIFKPKNTSQEMLRELEERRQELTQMLVQEKNRSKSPLSNHSLRSITSVIECLKKQLEIIDNEMKSLIESDEELVKKKEILQSVPGIGEITSNTLLALLPELGSLGRKQVASLCGLAPYPKQSGTKTWHSRTQGGRRSMRSILFLAAMGASRTKTNLGLFYERLVGNGKKKMVALTALMRKIIVIANARLRDLMRKQAAEVKEVVNNKVYSYVEKGLDCFPPSTACGRKDEECAIST